MVVMCHVYNTCKFSVFDVVLKITIPIKYICSTELMENYVKYDN